MKTTFSNKLDLYLDSQIQSLQGSINTCNDITGFLANESQIVGNLNNQTSSLKGSINTGVGKGVTDYEKLQNLPTINDFVVKGHKQGKNYKLIDQYNFITSDDVNALIGL